MPLKILRLGYTEMSLLFIYWVNKQKIKTDITTNNELNESKSNLIKWLYTTSGFYDKTQHGNYMNVKHLSNKDPIIYNKYMEIILDFIKNSDIYDYKFHNFTNNNLINSFKLFLNVNKEEYIGQKIIFNFIQNKKILIISPFSELMKQQYDSENLKKIYEDTPNIELFLTYTYPYTFFNNGPDNNILETCDNEYNKIINLYDINLYDNVIISCGAYSCLLAQKFYNINKNVCTIGGDLTTIFGIANNRVKERNNKNFKNSEYWILEIPDKYKPENYIKIEDGCYW